MAIEIDLGHNYLLTSDSLSFTLHKLHLNKNTDNFDRTPLGHYPNIVQVFEKLASHRIMTSNARLLSVMADMMAEIKADVKGLLEINAKDMVLGAGIEVEDKPSVPVFKKQKPPLQAVCPLDPETKKPVKSRRIKA